MSIDSKKTMVELRTIIKLRHCQITIRQPLLRATHRVTRIHKLLNSQLQLTNKTTRSHLLQSNQHRHIQELGLILNTLWKIKREWMNS